MFQPNHRGAYEYLWFEHKFSVLAIGIKAFQNAATKVGKVPQITSFLKLIKKYSLYDRPEWYNALLNAFSQLRDHLTRQEKFEMIKAILEAPELAGDMIYKKALSVNETSLFGCRLFFPIEQALFKFWDREDVPGLWSLFGPFQAHLTLSQVLAIIISETGISKKDLFKRLTELKETISIEEFSSWPEILKKSLMEKMMVATPGKSAILHPGVAFPLPEPERLNGNLATVSAIVIQNLWEQEEDFTNPAPELPEFELFKEYFCKEKTPGVDWKENFDPGESFELLVRLFYEQKQIESGQKGEGFFLF